MRRLIATTLPYLLTAAACASYCEQPDTLALYASQSRKVDLLACLEEDESWIKEETALALGSVRSEEVRAKLETMLVDRREKPWVRAAAADALGRLQHPRSFELLAGAVVEPGLDPDTKLALIEALCQFEDKRQDAVQAIAPLRDDEDLIVGALAEKKVGTECVSR